jgi:ATP-dependent Clp protease protease subunit
MENLINLAQPKPIDRNLFFSEQVDQKSISELTKKIIEINETDDFNEKIYSCYNLEYQRQPIKIYIDSYGGYVYQCFGLLSIIEASKTPIHTIVTGCAMSCGFMILISGHKRFGYSMSTPLYHQVSTGFEGKVADMELDLIETKRLQKMIEQITLKRTKITKQKLSEIYKQKIDWFMNAKQALQLGVIDEII